MAKARAIMFSDDDLRTLVDVLTVKYHKTVHLNLAKGKPGEDEITEHLAELARVTYNELIRRQP